MAVVMGSCEHAHGRAAGPTSFGGVTSGAGCCWLNADPEQTQAALLGKGIAHYWGRFAVPFELWDRPAAEGGRGGGGLAAPAEPAALTTHLQGTAGCSRMAP